MKISLTTLVLATVIQLALTAPLELEEFTNHVDLKLSKRYKLFESVSENIRNTIWSNEVYAKMTQYMTTLKEWSNNDETLKKSSTYSDIQDSIDTCLKLLNELKTVDPESCKKQLALTSNHKKMKALFRSLADEKLQQDWVMHYVDFLLELRVVMNKSHDNLYATVAAEVNSFINSLDDVEEYQEVDILQWNDKFAKETDSIRKKILIMEFMSLFPDERNIVEAKCEVQYSNGL